MWFALYSNILPRHPSSFRNQQRVYEAEVKAIKDQKARIEAQREFDKEQEVFLQMGMMPGDEAEKLRKQQSLAWMYTKPPGLEAALQKDAEIEAAKKRDEVRRNG